MRPGGRELAPISSGLLGWLLAGLLGGVGAASVSAQDALVVDEAPVQAQSPWARDRGLTPRAALPGDDIPQVAFKLEALLRDRGVRGFYDGQFASTMDDFDALARLVQDESIHHTLRMMAVMALQEAGDGDALAAVLEPLVISPDVEFQIEQDEWRDNGRTTREEDVRLVLQADLSRHARFALAKDGQPARVLEKIETMKRTVWPRRVLITDPLVRSVDDAKAARLRSIWFDIAYHYQQYDDFEQASTWFRELCDNLDGDDTRWAHYNLACIASLQGRPEEALQELQAAVDAGFLDVGWLLEDGDLKNVRERDQFRALVESLGGSMNSNTGEAGQAPGEQPQPLSGP